MNSISASSRFDSRLNNRADSLLMRLEGVGISFNVKSYRPTTWRDSFTNLFRNPVAYLENENDDLCVIDNISVDINSGDRIALIGVNGAGKTTLCRCLAGIFDPTAGRVFTYGDVRAVFSNQVGILPELTGRENAYLLAEFLYPREPNLSALVEEACAFSELKTFLDRPYRLYSNGMQARLYLSLVSARPAEILILDEVFEGADVFFSEKISRRVLELSSRSGATIFVSHNFDQTRALCNRALVLSERKIIFDGEVEPAIAEYTRVSRTL